MIRFDYKIGDVLLINPNNVFSVKYLSGSNKTEIESINHKRETLSGNHTTLFESCPIHEQYGYGELAELFSNTQKNNKENGKCQV